MIYRRLFWFETTKKDDQFKPQVKNKKWQHGKVWSKVEDYGWDDKKVKDCVGKLSGMRFKFRRNMI